MDNISYSDWNKAMGEYFFGSAVGKIVYLYINDSVIVELGIKLGLAQDQSVDSFCKAVKSYVPSVDELFQRAHTRGKKWFVQGQDGYPPFIALLALTVLAATRMGPDLDEGIGGGNYYMRLRQLLGMEGQGRPRGFELTEELWNLLTEWQKVNEGRYGYTNAFPFGNKYIGYPKSQCLVREAERPQLYHFFNWAGYHPKTNISLGTMRDHFEMYLSSRVSRLSRFFSQNVNGIREAITSIVNNEFSEWDGTSGEPRSRLFRASNTVTYSVHIVIQFIGYLSLVPSLEYFSPVDEDDLITSERPVTLDAPGFTYKNQGLSCSIQHFDDLKSDRNWVCSNTGAKIVFRGSNLFVFRKAVDFGRKGWISRSDIMPGQEHIFLYHKDIDAPVESFIQQNRCSQLDGKITSLPDNWCIRIIKTGEYLNPSSQSIGIRISDDPINIQFHDGLRVGNQEWLADAPPYVSISAPYRTEVKVNDVPKMSIVEGSVRLNVGELSSGDVTGILKVQAGSKVKSILLRNDHRVTVEKSDQLAGAFTYEDVSHHVAPFHQEPDGRVFIQYRTKRVQKQVPRFIHAPAFNLDRSAFDLGIDFLPIRAMSLRPIDLFVEYLSIRENGNWASFVKGLRWCFGDSDLGLIAYRVRRILSRLGIVDFQRYGATISHDWRVNPTSVAAIPGRDDLVSLTGARTRSSILDWVTKGQGAAKFYISQPRSDYEPLNVFILADSVDVLEEYMDSLNIRFNWGENYFAFDLLQCLPSLKDMIQASPQVEYPPQNWKQRCWYVSQQRWVETHESNHVLSEYTNGFGSSVCLVKQGKRLIQVDRDVGKLFVASLNRQQLFSYSNYHLAVRKQYHVPELFDRVLVSCSGQSPEESGPYLVYKNIPLEIALPLAFKLGFDLRYEREIKQGGLINERRARSF